MYYLDVVDPFGKPSRPTVESAYTKILRFVIAKDKIGYNFWRKEKLQKQQFLRCYLEFIYI
jgi:hypothetical protein